MQPISATDAIGLAFSHARTVLAPRPFRLGRFFKLALVAAVTQASFFSVSISYPLQGGQFAFLSHTRQAREQFLAGDGIGALVGAVGLGVLAIALAVVLLFTVGYLYLLCRVRATLFDLVVFREGRVREAWRRCSRPARRYLGLYLLAMLLFLSVLGATVGPALWRFVQVSAAHAGGDVGASGAKSLLVIVGMIWLLLPIWIAVDALLEDFILPGLALDQQAPVSAAFARLGSLIRRKPGQLLLFLVLRTVVGFGIGLALVMVTLVGVGLVALSGYGVGRLLYSALWAGGMAGHTVFFAYVAGAALLVMALYLLGITAVYGVTGTFKVSYAAYFYAGYYPELAAGLGGQPPDEEEMVGAGLPGPLPPMPSLRARADIW
jgi:hypothetical protein